MTPIAQGETDMESHTSAVGSQNSPLRRRISEPNNAISNSVNTTTSPPPKERRSMCSFCGLLYEPPAIEATRDDALQKHLKVCAAQPHARNCNMPKSDEEESQLDDDECSEDEEMVTALENGLRHTVEPDEYEDSAVGAEDELAEAAELYDEEKDRVELDGDDGEGEAPEGESDVALSNQLHEFSREQDSVSVDKRLHNFWNVHDVRKFAEDYDASMDELSATWAAVFHDSSRGKKRDMPELIERPNPYKKSKVDRGDFLEITSLEAYLSQLRDPELRSSDELYAITENVAYALKVWQEEYLAIDRLQKLSTRHNLKITSDPRKLERPQVFEDKKEAMLYGYKHDPKEDKVGNQNPFVQGGFKPTPAQYRKMLVKNGSNNPNPDGWPTITKFDVEHVPKFQNPPREDFVGKATRKRKAAELEAASRANDSDEAGASDAPTPGEPDGDFANPAKRRARTRRQAAEAETIEYGAGRAFSTRGRGGRARGRGAAHAGSRAGSEVPMALAPETDDTTARSTPVGDASTQSRAGSSQLVPIEPAPNGGSVVRYSKKGPSGPPPPQETPDSIELARRQKIANSKNPKRTEAMLNHWARFNREGRVRNPKRSKAQIEADRAAEAARKAIELPRPGIKKKKSESPSLPLPREAGLPPMPVAAPPPHLAPGPHTHTHTHPHPHPHPHPHTHPHPHPHPHHAPTPQLPPIAAARAPGPLAPYPPPALDPRAVAPFPPRGPPGPLQQPPQPYRTPYPDFYIPYGAAAALPPPGHPQSHPPGPPRPA
ncbi:hypothetical protein BJX65DRAFT_89027 [Aspergillus insuetus]